MNGDPKGENTSVLLNKISKTIADIEISDIQGMAELHTLFQELAAVSGSANRERILFLSESASSLVEKIVINDVDDPEKAMKDLNSSISAMLKLIKNTDEQEEFSGEPEALKAFYTEDDPEPDYTGGNDMLEDKVIANTLTAIESEPELVADFISESNEHLDSCNEHMLTLENNPEDSDALNAIFRAFHTIKGVASFLNLEHVRTLAHQAEYLLDKARCGKIILGGISMDIIFESVDTLKSLVKDLSETCGTGKPRNSVPNIDDLIKRLEAILEPSGGDTEATETPESQEVLERMENEPSVPTEMIIAEIPQLIEELNEHIEISEENIIKLEDNPRDKDALDSLFRSFHTIKGSSGFLGIRPIESLAHHTEALFEKAGKGELVLKNIFLDTVFEVIDSLKQIVEALGNILSSGTGKLDLPEFPELCEMLESLCDPDGINPEYKKEEEKRKKKKAKKTEPDKIPAAMTATKRIMLKETVKVDSERLDKLLDMIGELVIAETMVTQSSEVKRNASPKLLQNVGHLDKITRELQEMATSLRMVPVNPTFQKMARLVRDLSKKMKKDIEFVMNGEETELDKTVVDKIGDPLVHMIRNAVDHGIEDTAQDRIEAGKPPKGKINLKAFHKGGNIYIEIADDGKGLKRETILQKAIDKGIISNGSSLTDKEVWSLIFAPGFSTAQKITEVSGRGVGMDVVKKNIEQLRGSVEIQSEYGKGSVFSMRLPLTLAIIDGMVISSCGEKYVIPTLSIVTSVRLDESDIKTVQSKGRVLSIQNELIPLFELEKILELKAPEKSVKPEQLIVIVEDEGQKTGIIIDQLLGQQQIVIKNLGKYLYGNTPGISGGAIMPDGSVGLIIDVAGLVRITSPLSESAVNSKGKANVQQN